MNLEDQVCSLELAKKLKELGVKQESLFYWARNGIYVPGFSNENEEPNSIIYFNQHHKQDSKQYSAFTVSELCEILPVFLDDYRFVIIKLENGKYGTDYIHMTTDNHSYSFSDTEDNTIANACAKMLIYLIENKLIGV